MSKRRRKGDFASTGFQAPFVASFFDPYPVSRPPLPRKLTSQPLQPPQPPQQLRRAPVHGRPKGDIPHILKSSNSHNQTTPNLSSRKPRPGSHIIRSDLRPHVAAADRISTWVTPYTREQRDSVAKSLSTEILHLGEKAAFSGIVESTKSSYGAGLLRFTQFCDSQRIDEKARMPASEYLVIAFIGHYMGSVSGKCISNWLSGLRAWHDLNGAAWPENSRLICFARAGSRTAGAHCRRAKRNPISVEHMFALFRALNFAIPFHCAVWAVACMAFWGCRRLGELTIPSSKAFNPLFHASRSTLVTFSTLPDGSPKAVSFPIPWTKTTKELGANVCGTACPEALSILCPFSAMTLHLHANRSVPKDFSLFAYVADDGSFQHMLKPKFLALCQALWKRFDLPNVHGHSFRIGGAVELLLAGVPPHIVAATGGWTSLAFLIYWRRFEDILPSHILKAYNPEQIARLKASIDAYQKSEKFSDKYIDDCINGVDINDLE